MVDPCSANFTLTLHGSKENIMTRLLPIAVVLGLFLATSDGVDAKGHSSGGSKGGSKGGSAHNSHGNHNSGKGMSKGNHGPHRTYGRDHRWNSRYWNSRWGCDFCYSAI